MRMLILALAVLAGAPVASASAQIYTPEANRILRQQRYNEYRAERNLEHNSVMRDLTGPRYRPQLERSCTAALESGVENSVRRSYGCSN